MELRNVRVALFEHATLATLETNINTFLDGISDPTDAGHDRQLVSIQVAEDGGNTVVLIAYTE